MAVKFNQPVKHGSVQLVPGVAVAFEDPDADPYFIAAGWAEATTDDPVFTYTEEQINVDPLARSAETGGYILPKLAEAHLEAHDGNPPPARHEQAFRPGLIIPESEA